MNFDPNIWKILVKHKVQVRSELMMVQDEKSVHHLWIHPSLRTIHFRGGRDILLKDVNIKNVNLMVTSQEKSGDHQSQQDPSSGGHKCLNKMSLQSASLTDRYCHPWSYTCG